MNRQHIIKMLTGIPMLLLMLFCGQALASKAETIKFSELYGRVTVRGVEYSQKLKELKTQKVQMKGYMAPPLKPKLDFFVLTRFPMATCPFCSSAADWPPDIVLVIVPKGKELESTTRPIEVIGTLDIGVKRDEETGFVSLVRIYADKVILK